MRHAGDNFISFALLLLIKLSLLPLVLLLRLVLFQILKLYLIALLLLNLHWLLLLKLTFVAVEHAVIAGAEKGAGEAGGPREGELFNFEQFLLSAGVPDADFLGAAGNNCVFLRRLGQLDFQGLMCKFLQLDELPTLHYQLQLLQISLSRQVDQKFGRVETCFQLLALAHFGYWVSSYLLRFIVWAKAVD